MFIGIALVFVGWVLFALYSETPQQRRQKQLAGEPAVPKSAPKPSASVPVTQPEPKPSEPVQTPPAEQPKPAESKPARQKPAAQIHVVQTGETLSSIAGLYYGSPADWQKILDANSDILQNPSQIRPGMRLKIPPK